MEGARRVGQHDVEATTVSDHAGKRVQLGRRAVERLGDPHSGRAGKPGAQLPLVEIGEDIVHLSEAPFSLDLCQKS